ncbi:hypothetical protein [Yinghuangia soli]|uniref:LPXTG cell wall anchor domain-containing protein n=1 Tax=Yinghuangia soli TaxID=2908204 RepID=A0AA41PYJ7_9ACTN|nr:hypothetical protein [Yinghuangia soli]MCF2526842.1 hypothetical protein [Yinghuangia soli]
MSVSVPRSVRAAASAAMSAAVLGAVLATAGPAAATTAPDPGKPPLPGTDQVERTLRDVVDLQLLQPTCGQPGALTVAAVEALRTIGVEAKATGLPKLDLGPLGWVGIGTQYPGRAVALELHLLPGGPAPVNLTIGEKACPRGTVPTAGTPTATATGKSTATPGTAAPAPRTPTATASAAKPAAPVPAGLAETGAGSPAWPYAAAGAVLFAAGLAAAAVARRRRMR